MPGGKGECVRFMGKGPLISYLPSKVFGLTCLYSWGPHSNRLLDGCMGSGKHGISSMFDP